MRVDLREPRFALAPARLDVAGVEEGRIARFALPQSLMRDLRNCDRAFPRCRAGGRLRHAVPAHEGELPLLAHHAAIGLGEAAILGAVDDHLRDRQLAIELLAARLEIDRTGKAVQLGIEPKRITDEALALSPKPRVIWMQLSVRNDEAAARAEAAGLQVIMNRCPKMEYGKLSGEWAWVGGDSGIISSRKQSLHESGKVQSLGLGPRKGY